MAAAIVLLVSAILKPWTWTGPAVASPSPAVATVAPTAVGVAVAPATPRPAPDSLCQYADTWLIVADGSDHRSLTKRTWLIATPGFAPGMPDPAALRSVTISSPSVEQLGLCIPEAVADVPGDWYGRLWSWRAGAKSPWTMVGTLDPAPGSFGALARPVAVVATAWPPGQYFVEARLGPTGTVAWLGVRIAEPAAG
jgi:hypothetical protein